MKVSVSQWTGEKDYSGRRIMSEKTVNLDSLRLDEAILLFRNWPECGDGRGANFLVEVMNYFDKRLLLEDDETVRWAVRLMAGFIKWEARTNPLMALLCAEFARRACYHFPSPDLPNPS